MELLDLYINGFGKFQNQQISFSSGLNVIAGNNEAGKSTIHTFIRAMFFGIEPKRGRATKTDLYTKYRPWENPGTYEGRLRVCYEGQVYRIERVFDKSYKSLKLINETLGIEVEPAKPFLKEMLCELSELGYQNTISIEQLKGATDQTMATELHNYIANLNTTGDSTLNISKAIDYLKKEKRQLEKQLIPNISTDYSAVLESIQQMEQEVANPLYENQLPQNRQLREDLQKEYQTVQTQRENILQKMVKAKQVLSNHSLSDKDSIQFQLTRIKSLFAGYEKMERIYKRNLPLIFGVVLLLFSVVIACGTLFLLKTNVGEQLLSSYKYSSYLSIAALISGGLCFVFGTIFIWKRSKDKRNYITSKKILEDLLSKYVEAPPTNTATMAKIEERFLEFHRLSLAIERSENSLESINKQLSDIQMRQNSCNESIEIQQRLQWELEQKLEALAKLHARSEELKDMIEKNDRILENIDAITLAINTIHELSTSIHDSFGIYLNKKLSQMVEGITDGAYNSLSVDESLNVFLNTYQRLIPIYQVSSGTIDQVYLALRLAIAQMIQGNKEPLPLFFDESFSLFDEKRLFATLNWLTQNYTGQLILFTCHKRELKLLEERKIPYHKICI